MNKSITIFALIMSGCSIQPPNLTTGEGCWRYGVEERDNTGPMSLTLATEVPVVRLGRDQLQHMCGVPTPEPDLRFLPKAEGRRIVAGNVVRGCYLPPQIPRSSGDDTIYMYKFGGTDKQTLWHEQCHIRLGIGHNACNGTYGNAGTADAPCVW